MAGSYDPSASSGSGLSRRQPSLSRPRPPPAGPLRADIDPPPRPRPALQSLAFGLIVFLGCLQFLPATHFRDPTDPHRNWIPLDPNRSQPISANSRTPEKEEHSAVTKQEADVGKLHIFSWMDCLDLRVLAVLANSTLSSSRHPENIFFHFFVSETEDEKLSYYKLKVLLPRSNLEIIGLKEAKEKLISPASEGEFIESVLHEIVPFAIPSINARMNKFLYVSPNTIVKGNVEELFDVDLGSYAIAAAEDCNRRLGDYVNFEVLNAIQRTKAKTWVSDKPYDKDACLPDFNVLLFDARKLDNNLLDVVAWWSKILNLGTQRPNQVNPAIALAFYRRYLKLPVLWKHHRSTSLVGENETNVLPFDGPKRVCSNDKDQQQNFDHGSLWKTYLTPKFDAVLSHTN
ncbi:unnamed protein product [Musa textilis]